MNKFSANLFAQFAAECLEPAPLSRLRASEIAASSAEWCARNRAWPLDSKTLAHGLVAMGCEARRFKHGVDYFGVALRTPSAGATLRP